MFEWSWFGGNVFSNFVQLVAALATTTMAGMAYWNIRKSNAINVLITPALDKDVKTLYLNVQNIGATSLSVTNYGFIFCGRCFYANQIEKVVDENDKKKYLGFYSPLILKEGTQVSLYLMDLNSCGSKEYPLISLLSFLYGGKLSWKDAWLPDFIAARFRKLDDSENPRIVLRHTKMFVEFSGGRKIEIKFTPQFPSAVIGSIINQCLFNTESLRQYLRY